MAMIPFEETKKKLMKKPEFRCAYEALEPKYALIEAMVKARMEEGLTQKEVAKRMKTSQSAIARLEGGEVPPTIDTIARYAKALGRRAVIELVKPS